MTLAAALTWIVLSVGLTFTLLYLTSEWWLRH
jgi:hypothetical protein